MDTPRSKILAKNYLAITGLAVALLFIPAIIHWLGLFLEIKFIHVPMHSAIEAIGAFLGIFITALIFSRYHSNKRELDYPFVAMAFMGMGIFDLFHSFMRVNDSFVFSHIISLLSGGFWYGILVLPKSWRFNIRSKYFLLLVLSIWLLLIFAMSFKPEILGVAENEGNFTSMVRNINYASAFLFFLGSIKLLIRYRKQQETEIFLFFLVGIIQVISRITFSMSAIWDVNWWLWHLFRFLGSGILFFFVISFFNHLIKELVLANTNQQTILNAMPFGAVLIDRKKRIRQINNSAQQLTGFQENDVIGKSCYKTVCMAQCDKCPVIDYGKNLINAEKFMPTKEGKDISVLKSVVPIKLNNEDLLLEGFVDITEQKRAEQNLQNTILELERSNAVLERFAFISSHDLQEPLRKIKNFSDLFSLKYHDKVDKKGQQYISKISNSALRMQLLIQDLLQYSRISMTDEGFEWVETSKVVQQLLTKHSYTISQANAQFTVSELPNIWAHTNQFHTLLFQLIDNALKFRGDESPAVTISCKRLKDDWVFTVKDNGIGFEQKYEDRIFEIFQQLQPKGTFSGTGIGLALCKRIVDHHNGKIWVKSVPDEGSAFSFSIPFKEII